MTSYPRVAFVSAPDVSATVRLDLNEPIGAAGCQVNADGFTLGAPSLDGDPTAVGQVWGYRAITLTPRLTGAKAAALAALSTLSREQLRSENWLLFQLDASTDPVWFKVYRSSPQPLSLDEVDVGGRNPDAWQTTLTLTAEPFGYGARETLSTITFGSALNATHPMHAALPALKGDAPTGLRIAITATTGDWLEARIGVVAADASVSSPVIDIGASDGLTAGTGTSGSTTDSAYLGGSYRTVTVASVTPPTSNLLQRLSGTMTPPPAGQYKVLLKCQGDPASTTVPNSYSFTFGQTVIGTTYGKTVTVDTPAYDGVHSADRFDGWVDLGEFTFPAGIEVPRDLTLTQPTPAWSVKVGTPTGAAGTVRLDAIKLVPISGPTIRRTTMLRSRITPTYALMTTPGFVVNWDADDETYWRTLSGALNGAPPAIHEGAFPEADPGATQNLLVLLPTGSASEATGVWSAAISYHPRFLHIGDGT